MNKSQSLLKNYATSRSKFFNLPDGEEADVVFLKAEEVPNNFDGGKTTLIRYYLEVDGKELIWDRVSRQLAQEMAKIDCGDRIYIRRIGEKSKTKYTVRKVEK